MEKPVIIPDFTVEKEIQRRRALKRKMLSMHNRKKAPTEDILK